MARRRTKKRKKKAGKMRAGTCRRTKTGQKYCKTKSGKVRFKKG